MLNPDLVRCIRAIFLHDGQRVTAERAAELLGWTLDEMDAAIKWGEIEIDRLSLSGLISPDELIEQATHQWPFSVIQEALGEHAVDVLSPGMLMRPLVVPVHEYHTAMLDYFAAKGHESVENVLSRILDAYALEHIDELVANVPIFREAAGHKGAAKNRSQLAEAGSVNVARAAIADGRSARASHTSEPSAHFPSPNIVTCARPAATASGASRDLVVRDHGGPSLSVTVTEPASTLPQRVPLRSVPESPSSRRRRLAKRGAIAAAPIPLPPPRRGRRDGIRECTVITLPNGRHTTVPFLRLSGRWMEACGFTPQTRVYIQASSGQIVVSVTDPAVSKKATEDARAGGATIAELLAARAARRAALSPKATAAAARRVVRHK